MVTFQYAHCSDRGELCKLLDSKVRERKQQIGCLAIYSDLRERNVLLILCSHHGKPVSHAVIISSSLCVWLSRSRTSLGSHSMCSTIVRDQFVNSRRQANGLWSSMDSGSCSTYCSNVAHLTMNGVRVKTRKRCLQTYICTYMCIHMYKCIVFFCFNWLLGNSQSRLLNCLHFFLVSIWQWLRFSQLVARHSNWISRTMTMKCFNDCQPSN